MDHQDLIKTCVFEHFQGLLFSDLSGPLRVPMPDWMSQIHVICPTYHDKELSTKAPIINLPCACENCSA